MTRHRTLPLAAAVVAALSTPATAVTLDPGGLGQALIYPHYTVRTANGNAFHTYVSVVNQSQDVKVVRMRFREGKNGRPVHDFNLYLSPNDVWAGAVVPLGTDRARLISSDTSCVDPVLDTNEPGLPGHTFQNASYSGGNDDGYGAGLDRTREGWIEVIEMGRLGDPRANAFASAATHGASGAPTCTGLRGPQTATTVGPVVTTPTGGLLGSLTLINVANGMDFSINAEALADLATLPMFRPPADPYPDFNATEVTPVTTVIDQGTVYQSRWTRGADAVTAAIMRTQVLNEYLLEPGTNSQSDWVFTLPTKRFYATAASVVAPFTALASPTSCERVNFLFFNREERGASMSVSDFPENASQYPELCWASSVLSLREGTDTAPVVPSRVLGSVNSTMSSPSRRFGVTASFRSGYLYLDRAASDAALVSQPDSRATNLATGAVTVGAHRYRGWPVTGFVARSLQNGTLSCGGGSCQGNYGGAFPHRVRQGIELVP